MRRREFLGALAGVAALPFAAARAQQPDRVRRIGVLLPAVPDDRTWHDRLGGFL